MAQPYTTIETRIDGRVAVLSLNRPAVLNAINRVLMEEVTSAMTSFIADPQVHAIILHGRGRAFSAGFDMKESAQQTITDIDQWREVLGFDFDFLMQFWDCPKPTIAAVHAFALAGGFEMALSCDITIAAERTRFGEPEARFGSGIVALLLPWMTTPKLAKEMLLTGSDQIDAPRALAMGIVNRVVPLGTELDTALQAARDIAAAAPRSVQLTKRAINRGYEIMGVRQALLAAVDTDVLIESGGGTERAEFNRLRREVGLKAALAWRDARVSKR